MKLLQILPMLLLLFLPRTAEASRLSKVSRLDTRDVVQLYFTFDEPPKFSTFASDRRLDLIFSGASAEEKLELFAPDADIVKILPRQEGDELIFSLFFRYKPQRFSLTKNSDDKIVCEILLGNEYSKTYEKLAERLKGVQELDRVPVDYTNPTLQSPYRADWRSFFSSYEAPLSLEVPVRFTPPPFPIARFLPPGRDSNLSLLPAETMELAAKGAWVQLGEAILAKLPQAADIEAQKILALSLGEALLHAGDFPGAYRQLYLLKEGYPEELLGSYANYLLIYLKARHEDANIAEYEFQALEKTMGKNSPIAAHVYVGQVDAALASGKHKRLNELLLRDDIALPEELRQIVRIRQADYWHAINQPIKAFAAYRLQRDSAPLATMPYSLNGYCSALYQQKVYGEAADCYQRLETLLVNKEQLGLAAYRKLMARLNKGGEDKAALQSGFAQLEAAYPDSEAGLRAAMKKTDLVYLNSPDYARSLLERYTEIATQATKRGIREEAMFKQALLHSRLGERAEAVELLQILLREFLSGDVRISAQALLIDLLPQEIKRLAEGGKYVEALVLARQHREFFQKNWIDKKFLGDIAQAYHRIGLFDEAQKLYLYLIEVSGPETRERHYLPMISAAFDQGSYSLVEDYGSQYLYNYPEGEDRQAILLLRLRALAADGRLQEALRLLPDPLPEDVDMLAVAAAIHFRLEDYPQALKVLLTLRLHQSPLGDRERFMLAECLFRTGAIDRAEPLYADIGESHPFYEQSLFRRAEIARGRGNEQEALSFFSKIVETGKNPLWKKFAERELQFATLKKRR